MKLELGPESNKHTKYRFRFDTTWTTMGLSDKNRELDLVGDMNHRWPLESDSCSVVFASHVLEHARNPIHWVREAWRVLEPGGLLRVSVPNSVWLMNRYLSGKSTLSDFARNFRSWHGSPETKAHWHPFDHQTCEDLLRHAEYRMLGIDDPIREILFTDVRVGLEPNVSGMACLTDDYFSTRYKRSIICEASKP